MRKLIIVLSIFTAIHAEATQYYFDPAGADGNSGTSTGSPWATLTKFNATTFAPGDSIFFKRGGSWLGQMTPKSSGTSAHRIFIGAYGTGADPLITGFASVSGWTNIGGNIWQSNSAVSTYNAENVVLIGGKQYPMGRYPNTGYLQYQSATTNTSITSSSLTGTPNWTGADVVFKPQKWILSRCVITAQSGGTLTYTAGTGLPYVNGQSYNGTANFGFFIQNAKLTLAAAFI